MIVYDSVNDEWIHSSSCACHPLTYLPELDATLVHLVAITRLRVIIIIPILRC